jgi:hypothetical protein
MSFGFSPNSSQAIPTSGRLEGPTSIFSLRTTATALLGLSLLVAVLGNSKSSRKVLSPVFYIIDLILGGAPRAVAIPGPLGLPLVGNLYEVCFYILLTVTVLMLVLANIR